MTELQQTARQRAWELDALRGFAIILVVWDHTMYDLAAMFNFGVLSRFAIFYENSWLRYIFWPVFVFIFFFVSGICTVWSRNNFTRGLKLAAVAVGLSLVTWLADYFMNLGCFILFGVLHCLALCILLYAVISWIIRLINKNTSVQSLSVVYLTIAGILFVVNAMFNVSLYDDRIFSHSMHSDSFLTAIVFYTQEMWRRTADYFPLLPFFAFFMLGAGLSQLLYADKKSVFPKADGKWNRVFTWCGRYSLLVYLASQVVVVGLLTLIDVIKSLF